MPIFKDDKTTISPENSVENEKHTDNPPYASLQKKIIGKIIVPEHLFGKHDKQAKTRHQYRHKKIKHSSKIQFVAHFADIGFLD
ncbi:MAG: hypothetical protein EAY75_14380 [Bacteroidetes bacterium]|nr:MAG: hypothetical protein EAY75_14380 [Bacteroidota bacterium]